MTLLGEVTLLVRRFGARRRGALCRRGGGVTWQWIPSESGGGDDPAPPLPRPSRAEHWDRLSSTCEDARREERMRAASLRMLGWLARGGKAVRSQPQLLKSGAAAVAEIWNSRSGVRILHSNTSEPSHDGEPLLCQMLALDDARVVVVPLAHLEYVTVRHPADFGPGWRH